MFRHLGKDYPYKARFQSFAKAMAASEEGKKLAIASLKDLANVFDKTDLAQKIKDNPDLLFWASNLILLGHANLNGDALRKEDGLRIYRLFQYKYTDIEHDRESIAGAIYTSGFSLYDSNKMVDEAFARETTEPLQLVIGGYLWRMVFGGLCDFIERASIESSPSYGEVSTSFELLFDFYEIGLAVGEDTAIDNARVINPSEKDFAVYSKFLRINDGTGYDTKGNLVFRILGGDIVPEGAGIVTRPASGLKGILAIPSVADTPAPEAPAVLTESIDLAKIAGEEATKSVETLTESVAAFNDAQEKNINLTNVCVSESITSIEYMKLSSVKELEEKWSEVKKLETAASVKDLVELTAKELAVATAREQIADAIATKSEEWAKEAKLKDDLVETAKANEVKAAEKALAFEKELTAMKDELSKLKAAQASTLAEEKFGSRMSALDEEFNLDDDDRAILGEDVRALPADSDEAFAKFMTKQQKLLKEKSKKNAKKIKADDGDDADAKASLGKEAVAAVKEVPAQEIPNAAVVETLSLKEQFKLAFGAGTTVGGILAKDIKQK